MLGVNRGSGSEFAIGNGIKVHKRNFLGLEGVACVPNNLLFFFIVRGSTTVGQGGGFTLVCNAMYKCERNGLPVANVSTVFSAMRYCMFP